MSLLNGVDPDDLKPPSKNPFLKDKPRATIHRWMIKGKLQAVRIGGIWLTTDKWVEEFIESSTKIGLQLGLSGSKSSLGNRQEEVKAAEEKWSRMGLGKKWDNH